MNSHQRKIKKRSDERLRYGGKLVNAGDHYKVDGLKHVMYKLFILQKEPKDSWRFSGYGMWSLRAGSGIEISGSSIEISDKPTWSY